MVSYLAVKEAHLTFVTLSITGFVLRGWWMWNGSALLNHRLTKVLPHVNDSLLLAAGIWLAVILRHYPGTSPWLTAKLAALLVYIVLGSIALKRGRTRGIRAGAFTGAVITFAYMVSVALTRSPWPFGYL